VRWRKPFITAVANFSYRSNLQLDRKAYADFRNKYGPKYVTAKAGVTALVPPKPPQ
jgi:NADH:ubiquinone oxidoreductase subunit H